MHREMCWPCVEKCLDSEHGELSMGYDLCYKRRAIRSQTEQDCSLIVLTILRCNHVSTIIYYTVIYKMTGGMIHVTIQICWSYALIMEVCFPKELVGAAGSSFLVGTTLKCSLCSGSHEVQSGNWRNSLNLSLDMARSNTAISEEPNMDPTSTDKW